jgi:hypothetical protein
VEGDADDWYEGSADDSEHRNKKDEWKAIS